MNFDEKRAEWLVSGFAWLNHALPRENAERFGWIVQPTPVYFPAKNTKDHAFAEQVFERIREQMRIEAFPCSLLCEEDLGMNLSESLGNAGVLGESHLPEAAGVFELGPDLQITISYPKSHLRRPASLIATLAHELCNYLLKDLHISPPEGWEETEYLADLAAVREGYGIFLCESSFRSYQFGLGLKSGWGVARQGYLSQSEFAFSLALYARANGVEPMFILPHLGRDAKELFAWALDDIDSRPDWLAEVQLS